MSTGAAGGRNPSSSRAVPRTAGTWTCGAGTDRRGSEEIERVDRTLTYQDHSRYVESRAPAWLYHGAANATADARLSRVRSAVELHQQPYRRRQRPSFGAVG